MIGGVPNDFPVSARHTGSRFFVIEADEYDTAFFDKRSKFVHYRPRTAILNNIEFDHADIFDDLASIERQFHHLVRIVPKSGRVVANGADEHVKRVLTMGCWSPVDAFGIADGWQAGEPDGDGAFDVLFAGQLMGRVHWSLLGHHNRLNALAALAAARHVGVEPSAGIDALKSFGGVRRRMQERGKARAVTVYDDFAHHPTAIRTTLEGLRQRIGEGAHSRCAGAALEHHEARCHERRFAAEPGAGGPRVCLYRRTRLGRPLAFRAARRTRALRRGSRCAGRGNRGGGEGRRPRPRHVERRLRRHPREIACSSICTGLIRRPIRTRRR